MKFYPYKKRGGAEKVLAMLKRGHKSFSHKEGGKKFPLYKRVAGHGKFTPVLRRGPQKILTHDFPIL